MSLESNLGLIREGIESDTAQVRLTSHARIEAIKDGLTESDLRHVLQAGKIIEEYPERDRILLLGYCPENDLPCHIVVQNESNVSPPTAVIVTAYIPDLMEWHPDFKTRK